MFWHSRKKLPCFILTVYVTLTVAGTFSFAAAEGLRAIYSAVENPASGRIFSAENNFFIRQPVEGVAHITKTGNTQFVPLRLTFQRVVSLLPSLIIENNFSKLSLMSNAKIQYIKLKNTISLNLRI
jgi:hypothetical protein